MHNGHSSETSASIFLFFRFTTEYGQIVRVYGGQVTKRTEGADMLMVVSRSPIILGNMPPDSLAESLCEKVAFMGQEERPARRAAPEVLEEGVMPARKIIPLL